MTTQQLHDALTLLPEDLLLETDERRSRPKHPIPWIRYAAIAACFGLVLSASLFFVRLVQPKGSTEMAVYDAAEAPAALQGVAQEESLKEAPAEDSPAERDVLSGSGMADAELGETTTTAEASQDAVNTMARVKLILHTNDRAVSLSDADTDALRQLLAKLSYDPQTVCNCMAEYLLEYPGDTSWEINLTEGFVRTVHGQASLTEDQLAMFREIFEDSLLREEAP